MDVVGASIHRDKPPMTTLRHFVNRFLDNSSLFVIQYNRAIPKSLRCLVS